MKRSVFIVGNPTHYINALEIANSCKNRFEYKELLIISRYVKGIKKIDEYLQPGVWDETHVIDTTEYPWSTTHYKTMKHCYARAKAVMEKGEIEHLVVGHIGYALFYGLMQKFRKQVANFIILDDGTPSINILKSRLNGDDFRRFHLRTWRVLIKSIIAMRIFFPFCPTFKQLEFFTLFQLPAGKNDTVTRNHLNILSALYEGHDFDRDLVYFVGSNLVDKGLVSKKTYLSALKRICKEYEQKGKHLVYITHRAEKKEMLDEIGHMMSLHAFDTPMEFALTGSPLPGEIAGFFSSALFTLRKIHRPELKMRAYKFREADIIGSDREPKSDILNIYEALEADPGIELVDLESKEAALQLS